MAEANNIDPKAAAQSFDAAQPFDMAGYEPGKEFDVHDTSETDFFTLSPRTVSQAPTPDPQTPDPAPAPDPTAPIPADPSAPDPNADDTGAQIPPVVDLATENLTLKQQLAELSLYKPLGDMISRNPNFLQAVEASLKSLPQAEPERPKIERPKAPQKPAAYDPAEAMSVPGSESWKYREAQESFTGELFNYFEARDKEREDAAAQKMRVYEAQITQSRAQQELTHELTTRFGYTPERVDDFIKVMSDPASRSIENLVALHQLSQQKAAQRTVQTVRTAQKNVPLPVGITGGGGGGTPQKLSESDMFNIGLLSARR